MIRRPEAAALQLEARCAATPRGISHATTTQRAGWSRYRRFPASILLILITMLAAVACVPVAPPPPVASGTPMPQSITGPVPANVLYLSMSSSQQADPADPGKQELVVVVHTQVQAATSGVLAFSMVADPGSGAVWPYPAYPGGDPSKAGQQVDLQPGTHDVSATFPLRVRKGGQVQANTYNIQSGGFYDVSIWGGGLPQTAAADPVASFQTIKKYALPDFGGPPPTITPTPIPTPTPALPPTTTAAPTATPYPTLVPSATPTALPPPFAVSLLKTVVTTGLDGTVGAVPGIGDVHQDAPAGQTFVVAIFVVRRDLELVNDNPLPVALSQPGGATWQPINQSFNATTGCLAVFVQPFGLVSIVYDPRNQTLSQRKVAALVWQVPTTAVQDTSTLLFNGKPAAAYPASQTSWVQQGVNWQLGDAIAINSFATISVKSAQRVDSVTAGATPVPQGVATPVPGPGFKVTLEVDGLTSVPLTLRLSLVTEDSLGLEGSVDCNPQTFDKLVAGSPQTFACLVPLPQGTSGSGYHLGLQGTILGSAIPTQWVDLKQ